MKWSYIIVLFFLPFIANAQTDTSDWQDVKITTCLENEQVHKYMTEVNYTPAYINYYYAGYSRIKNYCDVETYYRKDQPAPVTIPLPAPAAEDLLLVYSDSLNTNRKDTLVVPAGSDEVHIWNLIPQRTYYYYIGELTKGTIHTTGQLRHIRIDSAFNVRDIGGYMTSSGKRLAYGKIFRGSAIEKSRFEDITEEERLEMLRLGMRAEIELRLPSDCKGGALPEVSGLGEESELLCLPMKDGDSLLLKYQDYYREAFQFIHKTLSEGNAVYVHCTYGADRTGMVCKLMEGLCGVSLGDIYKDYELTSMSNGYVSSGLIRYFYIVNTRLCKKLKITKADQVQTKVRNYLIEQCGLTEELLDSLIEMLLDDPNKEDTRVCSPVSAPIAVRRIYALDGREYKAGNGIYITTTSNGEVIKRVK